MDFVIIFMYGLVIGSFLNVVIYRVPLGKSIVHPGSACGACHTALKPMDLVPVLSYLWLRGKCRYCGAHVSWRYPGVEVLTGLLFVSVYFVYGFSFESLVYIAFVSLLVCVAFIDYDHRRIPNSLNLMIASLAVIQLILGWVSWKFFLWGGIVGAGVLLVIIVIGALFRVQAMGMGDLKLMLAAGLLLGPLMISLAYLIAFTLGGVVALFIVLLKRLSMKDSIPFGPFLSLGLGLSFLLYPYVLKSIL